MVGRAKKVARIVRPRGETVRGQRVVDRKLLLVRPQAVDAAGVRPNGALDGTDLTTGRMRATSERAMAFAFRLLRFRMRGRAELMTRLRQRGFSRDLIARVLITLEDAGIVNDERFADAWVATRSSLRPSGAARLRWELMQKGVARGVIDRTLEGLNPATEEDLALQLVETRRRRYQGVSRQRATRRLAGLLQRRGFAAEVIASVLRRTIGQSIGSVQE